MLFANIIFFSPAIYKEQKATLLQRLEDIKSKLKWLISPKWVRQMGRQATFYWMMFRNINYMFAFDLMICVLFLFFFYLNANFRLISFYVSSTNFLYIHIYNGYLRITFLFHFEIRSVTHEELQMRATHEYWTNISEKSYIQSVWWISMCRK